MAKKAGMATGIEVARISVKVSPDTKLFRRELKRDLDAIEKTLKPEVGVGADTDPFKREVRAATTDLPNAKIKVDADVDRMKKKLDTLSLTFENRVRGALDRVVNPETVRTMGKNLGKLDLGFDKQIETLKKEVRQARTDLQPEVLKQQFDTGGQGAELRRQIKEFDLALERAKASNEAVTVAINPDLNESRFVAARAKIAAIFSKPVKVDLDTNGVGTKGGVNLTGLIPSFGSGINPGGYIAILAGLMAVAAPLAGLITTSLLAIPGLISAITTPISAVILGMDGIKKAAEGAGLIGFDEKGKPHLGVALDEIKKQVSDVFENGLAPSLLKIKDAIPQILAPMPAVAQGMSDMFKGVTDAVTSPEGIKNIQGTIKNIGDSMTLAAPGVNNFTDGMIKLANALSEKFPGLADWFNGAGKSFNDWVTRLTDSNVANGDLATSFDNLGASINTVLGFLGQLGGKSIDFMSDPKALDGFNETLKKIGESIQHLIDLSATLNQNFQMLVQAWRPVSIIGDVIQGDLPGAWNTLKQLFNNTPFTGVVEDAAAARDAVNGIGTAADNTKVKLSDMMIPPPAAVSGGGAGNPLGDLLNGNGPATAAPPVVPAPDTAPAEAKITEYQLFVDTVSAQVRGSLEQATTGESLPAPNFDAFKAAWSSLPGFVTTAIGTMKIAALGGLNGIVAGFVTVGNQITAEVAGWAGKISGALAGLQGVGATAGAALMSGLIAGMQAGLPGAIAFAATVAGRIAAVKGPIPYDRKVLQPNGEALMFGLGVGMETGFQPVLDQAKSLAEQISKAFEDGTDVSGAIDTKQLDKTLEAIDLEKKRLKVDMNNAPDKESKKALKSQIDQLQVQRDALGYQKDRLKTEGKYGDAAGEDPLVKAASGLMKSPVDFAKATGKQFMSDIGISGEGAISKAVTEGISYIFQIGSVDEAMSIKDREESKKALSVVGR